MAEKYKRKRLWVDPSFQGKLLVRMAVYLFVFVLLVLHLGFAFEVMGYLAFGREHKGMDELYVAFLDKQRTLLISLVLFTPLALYNLLKFSHRIAGPLFRCRKVMDDMAQGKAVPEFKPRKHDLMTELFASFNGLIKECNKRVSGHANAQPDHTDACNGKTDAVTALSGGASAGSR